MKKIKVSKDDKLLTPPPTTGSKGLSTSSNISIDSAGTVGDDSTSLFPDLHKYKDWSSKTTSIHGDDNFDNTQ